MSFQRQVSFAGTGQGTLVGDGTDTGYFRGTKSFMCSLNLNGGTGTFQLQVHDGTGWVDVYIPQLASKNVTSSEVFSIEDPTRGGSRYRWNCSVHGSGAPIGRLWN